MLQLAQLPSALLLGACIGQEWGLFWDRVVGFGARVKRYVMGILVHIKIQ
jgi:hypothetical protein